MRAVVASAILLAGSGGCGRVSFDGYVDGAATDGLRDGTAGGDGDGPPPTSCGGLAATCGPGGTGPCCDSPLVPGGTYARSHDVAGDGMYPSSGDPATVSDFRLDRYEVTVGRFRQFVVAGMGTRANPPAGGAGTHPGIPGSGWDASWNPSLVTDAAALVAALKCDPPYQTWTDAVGGNENRPVNCITWYEAMAFCAWDDGFLPTEAEWNYAATGGSEQRAYPWSNPPGSVEIDLTRGSWNCMGDGVPGCTLADLQVVGTKTAGDGRWGHSDLGGNMWERTLDWYASAYPNPCTNCADLTPAADRVIRGGGYTSAGDALRAGNRYIYAPSGRTGDVGVRCARAP